MGWVTILQTQTGETEAARLEKYIQRRLRRSSATAKVFSTYNHKNETLKRDESYIIWISPRGHSCRVLVDSFVWASR